MTSRALLVLAVLAVACDSGSGEGGETDTDASGSTGTAGTSSGPSTTGPAPTTAPGTTAQGSSSSTSGEPGSSSTSLGETSADSSSTGDVFVGSPGCGTAATLPDGEVLFSLDGYDRRYVLRLPENYDSERAYPLIFALHGNGGNPDYWDQVGGDLDIRTAFASEAILVIPEAINNAWRDYKAEPSTWPALMDLELAAFDAMYESVSGDLCVDPDNVFSMGFSGGGSFSGVLGCRRDYIRGIAVGGSVIYFDEDDCVATPAAWVTIGDGELTDGREAYRDFFRDRAGCEPESAPIEPEGCVEYEGCGAESPVVFCGHPAGHIWPGIGTDAARAFFQRFYGAR
ncbi:MAG: hypothetical protein KUG77_26845 [Nannocystaceae bacterium]|nr:hypothetical protein [Nannocystaceae bacterium]